MRPQRRHSLVPPPSNRAHDGSLSIRSRAMPRRLTGDSLHGQTAWRTTLEDRRRQSPPGSVPKKKLAQTVRSARCLNAWSGAKVRDPKRAARPSWPQPEATGLITARRCFFAAWLAGKWRRPCRFAPVCRKEREMGLPDAGRRNCAAPTLGAQGCPRAEPLVLLRRQPVRWSRLAERGRPPSATEVDTLAIVSVEQSRDHRGDRCLPPRVGVAVYAAFLRPARAAVGAGGLLSVDLERRRAAGRTAGVGHGPDWPGAPKGRDRCAELGSPRLPRTPSEPSAGSTGREWPGTPQNRHLCQSIMYLGRRGRFAFERGAGVVSRGTRTFAGHSTHSRRRPCRRRPAARALEASGPGAPANITPTSATHAAPRARPALRVGTGIFRLTPGAVVRTGRGRIVCSACPMAGAVRTGLPGPPPRPERFELLTAENL